MRDNDQRPREAARAVARIVDHAVAIGEALGALQLGDDIEYGRRGERTRRQAGVSDPTLTTHLAWEAAALRDSTYLAVILTGSRRRTIDGALPLARTWGLPAPLEPDPQLDADHGRITDPQLAAWIDEAHGGAPSRPPWRHAVRQLAHLLHQTTEELHDGWRAIHAGRFVLGPGGMSVEDEDRDWQATVAARDLATLARDVGHLRRRVAPLPMRLCRCPDGCRRVAGPGGYADGCSWSGCADGCGRPVRRGSGATHPTCRKQKSRAHAAS